MSIWSKAWEIAGLQRNRRLPPVALRQLQERKLRALVRHAHDNVPYYASLFRAAGIEAEDVHTLDDLRRLPITSKADLRAAGVENTVARGTDLPSCLPIDTSGTTGEPFRFYISRQELGLRLSVEFVARAAAGVRPWDRLAILGPPHAIPRHAHHRLGVYGRQSIPIDSPVEEQIRELQRLQPTVLWAYPDDLRALMHALDYRLSRIVRPRIVITSSHVLDEALKEHLIADLHPQLFNFYAAMESGRIAAECRAHRGLHVLADQVILECLSQDRPAAPGQPGVVVLTVLHSYAMPFIRYRLGDVCTLASEPCTCGCTFPLISVLHGREMDMIQLPSGRLFPPGRLEFILRRLQGVDQYRLVQETGETFALELVARERPSGVELSAIRSDFVTMLGEAVELKIEVVEHIPQSPRKWRPFVSRLPPPHL